MQKLISSKTHGIIDYIAAPMLLVVPRLLKFPKRITTMLTGVALFHALYSLLTKYELGIVKVLPYKAHLGLDTALATATIASPMMFTEAQPRVAPMLVGGGVIEAVIVALSLINAPRKQGVEGLAEGFQDGAGL
jgi:hypothetical protein